MSDGAASAYTFICPECDERLEVNASMKEALIDRGCVICGIRVTEDAFTGTDGDG
jgi:transcription initiation factor IIE alpha subunit